MFGENSSPELRRLNPGPAQAGPDGGMGGQLCSIFCASLLTRMAPQGLEEGPQPLLQHSGQGWVFSLALAAGPTELSMRPLVEPVSTAVGEPEALDEWMGGGWVVIVPLLSSHNVTDDPHFTAGN